MVGSVNEQLDPIAGPLTVNGQSGQDVLTLEDDGTTSSKVTYTLEQQQRGVVERVIQRLCPVFPSEDRDARGSVDSATYVLQGGDPKTQVQVMATETITLSTE